MNIQGTEYAVPQQLYDQFTSTYTQLQSQNGSSPQAGLLQRLNIDLANWLTDLKNEGTEDVEGQKTIHISGRANVPQIVERPEDDRQGRRQRRWATSTSASSTSSTARSSRATSTSTRVRPTSCFAGSG